ncbi:hypothetical protein BDW62DRAFT_198172 [Aspergillus aurantiobrunneus]
MANPSPRRMLLLDQEVVFRKKTAFHDLDGIYGVGKPIKPISQKHSAVYSIGNRLGEALKNVSRERCSPVACDKRQDILLRCYQKDLLCLWFKSSE